MDAPRNSPICNSIDRISNLPENLIHYIFSFMDMTHVVRTCVLSKRWKLLWTCTPVLNFDFNLFLLDFHHKQNNGVAVQQPALHPNQNNAVAAQQLGVHHNQNNAVAAQQLAVHHNQNTGVVPAYQKLIQFVYQVFILHDNSDIQRVHLVCGKQWSSFDITASLTTWLVAAVRRNVQELYLDISGVKISRFPQCLFTCTTLIKLELKLGSNSRIMVLPASMGLPRLTFMKLDSLPSTDVNSINRLFERCPALESLIIEGHLGHMDLQISSLTLKHLKIVDFVRKTPSKDVSLTNRLFEKCPILESLVIDGHLGHMDLHISSLTLKHLKIVDRVSKTSSKIKIEAPNLVSFVCDDYVSKWYVLEKFASLVTADIDMRRTNDIKGKEEDCKINLWLFLRALSNAKELRLSGCFVVSNPLPMSRQHFFQLSNLRVLKLESYLSRYFVGALGWLLHLSPNVESLSIMIPGMLGSDEPDNEDHWKGVSFKIKLDHLRSVKIRGLLGYYNEIKLVELIFKNAVVLEKMVLFSSKTSTTDKRIITFGEKLLKLPRVSSNVYVATFFV